MREPLAERPHMPDYGVEAAGWRPLPWSWAEAKLAAGRNYWVSTTSAAGRPQLSAVWGVWAADECRYAFSCGPRSRKAANLRANPRVCVAVDDTVESLTLEGRADVVPEGARWNRWAERYLAKYAPIAPDLDAAFLRANLVVEVVADRAYAVIEREASSRPAPPGGGSRAPEAGLRSLELGASPAVENAPPAPSQVHQGPRRAARRRGEPP